MIESGPVYLICGTDITERKRHEEEVRTSRSRIVAAADDARRRLERNLHDGAQQRLVVLLLSLRAARKNAEGDAELERLLDGADRGALRCTAGPSGARARHPPRRADEAWPPGGGSRRGGPRAVARRALSSRPTATPSRSRRRRTTSSPKFSPTRRVCAGAEAYGRIAPVDDRLDRGRRTRWCWPAPDTSAGNGLCGLADRVAARDGASCSRANWFGTHACTPRFRSASRTSGGR